MNWLKHEDLLFYLCLCGLVVESLSLTREIMGSNPVILIFFILIFFATEFNESNENISRKLQCNIWRRRGRNV